MNGKKRYIELRGAPAGVKKSQKGFTAKANRPIRFQSWSNRNH